jgi:hypothetical protein
MEAVEDVFEESLNKMNTMDSEATEAVQVHNEEMDVPTTVSGFGCVASPTAEETDRGQWWFLEEVGSHPKMKDMPCLSCAA